MPRLRFEFAYEKAIVRRPPATRAEIAGVEARFGGTLPADYRQFLQSVNGGSPVAVGVQLPADPDADDPRRCIVSHPPFDDSDVECLYGLGSPEVYEGGGLIGAAEQGARAGGGRGRRQWLW